MRGIIACSAVLVAVLLVGPVLAQEAVQIDPNSLGGSRYRLELSRLNATILEYYAKALELNPQARGKIRVRVTINPSGDTRSVEIMEDTLAVNEVTQCVTKLLTEHKWPKSNATVFFYYTFQFAPVTQPQSPPPPSPTPVGE
jgi:hypothetical protein